MENQLHGIAVLLFTLLFYLCSSEFQAYLYHLGIGVAVPWGVLALLIGIAGLVWVFRGNPKK